MVSLIAAAGLLAVIAAWIHYLALIPRERVPRRPVGHLVALAIGCAAAAYAAWRSPGIATLAASIAALGLAAFFAFLLGTATQPSRELAVRAGEPLPPLRALTAEGEAWTSAELAGQRALIKLFRGHW